MARQAARRLLAMAGCAPCAAAGTASSVCGGGSACSAFSHMLPRGPSLQQLRRMGSGIEGVAPEVLSKARKLAIAVGAMAGGFGSLVGVGGGVLISPIIANACRSIPQRVISGTSLAAVATTGAAAGTVYLSNGVVDLTSAALLAAAAIVTAPFGARATHMFNCQRLRQLMGYWLLGVAPLVPLKGYLFSRDARRQEEAAGGGTGGQLLDGTAACAAPAPAAAAPPLTQRQVAPWRAVTSSDWMLVATGTVAGFASGLLGIGGGTIVTPALAIATSMPQVAVLGTSLAAMVLPSLVGLAQHARLGNVDWRMAAGMAAGTMVGGALFSRVAVDLPDGVLQWAFCAGMVILGIKTLHVAKSIAAAAAANVKVAPAGAKVAAAAAAPPARPEALQPLQRQGAESRGK